MPAGYRKLTPAELSALGFSPTSERYAVPATAQDPRADRGTISRRQAEQDRYTDAGWRGRADYERRYMGKTGRKLLFFEKNAEEHEKGTQRKIASPSSEFNKLYLKARKYNFDRGRKVRGPNSHMAKFLAYVGLRDPTATYNVGDTPRA